MTNEAPKTPTTLDADFIADRKQALQTEKANLERGLSKIAAKDPKIAGNYKAKFPSYAANNEADRMFENAEEVDDYVNNIGTENVLELRLVAVERALNRIEKGTYGVCSNCNSMQPMERLEADAAAERCLDCGKSN